MEETLQERSHRSRDLAMFDGDKGPLTPRRGGLAERVRSQIHNPAWAVATTLLSSFLALTIVTTLLGFFLTRVLEHGFIGPWDHHVSVWMVHHRAHLASQLSGIGTILAQAPTVIIVGLLVTLVLVVRHWGRRAYLLVGALVLELAVYITSNIIVKRPRPTVPHLGHTPPTHSYPSGHTAAALALYCGIAVVVSVATRRTVPRLAVWVVAIFLTLFVGWSRIYRGEHYTTDVIAGILVGVGTLAAGIFLIRVAVARESTSPSPAQTSPSIRRAV